MDASGNFFTSAPIVQPDTGASDQPLCYPPSSSYEARGSCADLWLAEWDPSGALRWTTIFGGASDDSIWDVTIHSSGDVFLAGNTYSTDLPVSAAAAQPAYAGARRDPLAEYCWAAQGDAFLVRLKGSTGEVRAATYFGGEEADAAGRLAVDAAGNVYLAGPGARGLTPTSGAYRPEGKQPNGYAVKWDSVANRFPYVALLDSAPAVAAVNREGELYVVSPGG